MALTTQQMLTEARDALHKLTTGQAVVQFRDQNGEMLTFTQATRSALRGYISELERTIAGTQSVGPIGFFF